MLHRDVFAPTKLGPIALRNATIKSATFEGAAPGGQVSDQLVEFHRAVARGGVGATTVAYLAVSPEGRTHRDQICLKDDVPGLRRLTDAIHAEGAAAIGQIGHAGPVANGRSNGVHAIGAWRMPSPLSMQMIRTATDDDINRITDDYVAGAKKAVQAGFDVLEIHLGHGYLLSSFLSPNLNKRKDRWAGSIDNRSLFPRQVVKAVRDAVGDEVGVTAKISMTDGVKGGLSVEDSLRFAELLEDDGGLDALELSAGSSLMNPMYLFRGPAPVKEFAAAMPQPVRTGMRFVGKGFLKSYPYDEAFLLPHARKFRERLTLPLILLGGISQRATLDLAMAEGFEFVAMARALLKEPDLINRMQTDGANSICSHCNKCMPTIYTGTRCVELGEQLGELGVTA